MREEYLFHIPRKHREEVQAGLISAAMRSVFVDNGHELSADVSLVSEGIYQLVKDRDNKREYYLEEDEKGIAVSEKYLHYRICRGREEAREYRCGYLLGRGGFGSVYLAQWLSAGVGDGRCALKILKDMPEKQLDREAKFLRELSSRSYVPQLEYCGYEDGENRYCMVMEYIDGRELKEYCHARDAEVKIIVMEQVAEIIHEMHNDGIIHCDLKPANIMITGAGKVYILDFGIAKMYGSGPLLTQATIQGTTAYMSPEQERGKIDHLSDIWALGVMLYELWAGELPFGERSKSKGPWFGKTWDKEKELRAICKKALAYSSSGRYKTAANFADALRAWRLRKCERHFQQARYFAGISQGRFWQRTSASDTASCEREINQGFSLLRGVDDGKLIMTKSFAELIQVLWQKKLSLSRVLIYECREERAQVERCKRFTGPVVPVKALWQLTSGAGALLVYAIYPRPEVHPLSKYQVDENILRALASSTKQAWLFA